MRVADVREIVEIAGVDPTYYSFDGEGHEALCLLAAGRRGTRSSARRGSLSRSCGRCCEKVSSMRTYTIVLEPEETGWFMASVPTLSGCFTQGATVEECRERAAEAIATHIAGLEADGQAVPQEQGPPQLLTLTVAA
jgi:antitoxin HicB